jgi:hypothetical protein
MKYDTNKPVYDSRIFKYTLLRAAAALNQHTFSLPFADCRCQPTRVAGALPLLTGLT